MGQDLILLGKAAPTRPIGLIPMPIEVPQRLTLTKEDL